MKSPRFVLRFLSVLLAVVTAQATIHVDVQSPLGNPSDPTGTLPTSHTHHLIKRAQYWMDYNDTTRQANWVAWNLTSNDVGGSGRSDDFFVDTSLPLGFYQVLTTDYSGSGYDRGHMCPSADRTITRADNDVTFFMSNMVPQTPDNNRGIWANFETYCRTLTSAIPGGNELLIISGTSGFGGSTLSSGVAIPGYTWKIVVVVPREVPPLVGGSAVDRIIAAGADNIRVIAIKVPNIAGINSTPWENFVTTPAQIQSDTGYTFFTAPGLESVAANFRNRNDVYGSTGAPTIVVQPIPQSAPVGGNATFTVSASGNAPLSYQWYHDDAEIPGATADTLSLTGVGAADVGSYNVAVTNEVGSTTSASVALVVTGLPVTVITDPVTRENIPAGSTVSFTVTAGGTAPFTYQWRKAGGGDVTNTGNASGANTPTLTLTNVQSADAGSYYVFITNNGNAFSATSNQATLTVQPAAPTITSQPANRSLAPGSTATFSVVAVGSEPLSYQWFKDTSPNPDLPTPVLIPGATGHTLTLTGITLGDAAKYHVEVTGIGSPAISSKASLTISSADSGSIYYTGGTVVQDFNTLPASGTFTISASPGTVVPFLSPPPPAAPSPINASGLGGWGFAQTLAAGTARFNVGTGSGNTGSAYSFGAASATERALGVLSSGTNYSVVGAVVVNNTGQTVNSLTLGYTGEQWRVGGGAGDKLMVEYRIGDNSTTIGAGSFTYVPELDFTSPVQGGAAAALNGNLATNRGVRSFTLTSLSWGPGQSLAIRWRQFRTATTDGLAVDDFSLSTTITGPSGPSVASTSPVNGATDLPLNTTIAVTFNQAVNASGSAFTINSASRGVVATTMNVSADKKVYTFTPPTNFDFLDTVSVKVAASGVTSVSTGLHPADDYNFQFVTAAPVAPGITAQPADQLNIPAGNNATFTVVTTGTAPFTYHWRKGTTIISSNPTAATATLVLANVQAGDAGSYNVIVGNGVGLPVTSGSATLTVTPSAPLITTQPVGQTLPVGDTITLSVAAKGTMPITYQWRRGTTVVGSGPTLVIANAQVTDSGSYTVVVSNGVGSPVTSSAATVIVIAPPSVLNYSGGTYGQDFNTLPSAGTFTFTGVGPFSLDANPGVNAAGLAGWSFAKYSGSGPNALFRFDTGGSNSGSVVSYGLASASDRALGSLSSGTTISRVGVTLTNTSGHAISYVTISYTGEQWRRGNSAANKFVFEYAVGVVDINTGTFTPATALDFTAPVTTGTDVALNGNLTPNRVAGITATLTNLNWAPGQQLVLRWSDANDGGNDDALAIDDFTLTDAPPVPVIVAQPAGDTVTAFNPTSFSVAATSLTPLSYQWLKDEAPILGNPSALTATLLIPSATTSDAGSYRCIVTNAFGSTPSLAATLIVNKALATVTLGNLDFVYNGGPVTAPATTSPAGLNVTITYDGGTDAPTNAGSYPVVAMVDDSNYYAETVTGTLTIAQATATVTLGQLSHVYDGSPKSVTVETVPAGLAVHTTYGGSEMPPTDAGSYAVISDIMDPNYSGGTTGTLTITPASATITLGNLVQAYDGTPKSVTVTTTPAGLPVSVTYNGSATSPTLPGSYEVVATSTDANQAGSATGTLVITITALVNHAPSMNGDVDGSVQVLLPESITLNGSAMISSDLLVPGMPTVRLNGNPLYVSTVDGTGSATPTSHVITLNGNSVLRHVVRRTDAIAMPVVAAPAAPSGTRNVSLNSAGQGAGDFATLRNLTLNGNGISLAVPAGAYGTFTLNGNNVLQLGVAGGTTPMVYDLQGLTLNGSSQVQVLGPVIINLATATSFNGVVGSPAHPEWLTFNLASGGLTVNGNGALSGIVNAPAGTVTVNGTLRGRVVADRLVINGNGLVTEEAP